MKSLVQYIKESLQIKESEETNDIPSSKKFTFIFGDDFENAKETKESIVNICNDKDISIDTTDTSIEITLTKEMCKDEKDKVESLRDTLEEYSTKLRNDSKNASSESFAQSTSKFKKTIDSMISYIEDSSNEDKKEDDNKKEEE